MGAQQPFLYEAERFSNSRFPEMPFDPKAVTRASFQTQRPKPKPNGPLVSINRHPDAHEAPKQRSMYWAPMSGRTKWWIKATRAVQLGLRVLELVAAAGILTLFILISQVDTLTAWVMRVTAGIVLLHTIYSTYHLCRPAGERTPGSSAAYHSFAALADLCVLPLYAFGALAAHNNSSGWSTLLSNTSLVEYFVPATFWGLIGAGSAHAISLVIDVWLALMFRRIHKMPPDMNPLEPSFTSRPVHKRNKSSVATTSTYGDGYEKRLSTTSTQYRRSGAPYEDLSRPPSIPFMHTRQGSETSLHSRDSRADLPARQYQVVPGNRSPRASIGSPAELQEKHFSAGTPPIPARSSWRGSYAEVSTQEPVATSDRPRTIHGNPNPNYNPHSRPSTGTAASSYRTAPSHGAPPTPPSHGLHPTSTNSPREARFTEAWYASESLINRTQARHHALEKLTSPGPSSSSDSNTHLPMPGISKSYLALNQRYDDDDAASVSIYSDQENGSRYEPYRADVAHRANLDTDYDSDSDQDDLGSRTPRQQHAMHPLRSNPTSPTGNGTGNGLEPSPYFAQPGLALSTDTRSPASARVLADISLNDRRVSGSRDTTPVPRPLSLTAGPQKTLNRKSSIQPESEFVAKPYGTLQPGTPPVMTVGSNRQVSSGYDDGKAGGGGGGGLLGARLSVFGRRNVSGKVAEEGRGGKRGTGLWEN